MADPFSQKSDQELWHEKVAIDQALMHRANNRRKKGEPDMLDELAVSTPGGWSGRIRGRDSIVIMLLAAALVLVLYVVHRNTTADDLAHAAMAAELQNVAYILTLSEAERQALDLAPPPSLAARMRRNLRPPSIP